MSDRRAYVKIASQDGNVFTDSRTGDAMLYTASSNQRLLLGTQEGSLAEVAFSHQSGVSVSRRLGVGGVLSIFAKLNPNEEDDDAVDEDSTNSFWSKNSSNDLYYAQGGVAVGKSNRAPGRSLDVAGAIAAERYVGAGSNPIVVGASVLPLSNALYDLGSSNMRFRDLFVSSGTIHIGDKTISSSSDQLVVDAVISSSAGFKIGETSVVDSTGLLSGNGSNLTTLNAGEITWGSLAAARLPVSSNVDSFCNDRVASANSVRLAYSNADSRLSVLGGTVNGNLVVTGDFTVSGTALTVNTESLLVKDNLVVLNSSLSNGTPPANLVSGLEVSRGSLCNYQFLFFESNDTFRIGEVGALQAVATRPDSVVDRSIAYWDSSSNWLAFDSNVRVSSAGDVALSGGNRYVGTTSSHNLALRTSNVDRITVLPNGNVGVANGTSFKYSRPYFDGLSNGSYAFVTKNGSRNFYLDVSDGGWIAIPVGTSADPLSVNDGGLLSNPAYYQNIIYGSGSGSYPYFDGSNRIENTGITGGANSSLAAIVFDLGIPFRRFMYSNVEVQGTGANTTAGTQNDWGPLNGRTSTSYDNYHVSTTFDDGFGFGLQYNSSNVIGFENFSGSPANSVAARTRSFGPFDTLKPTSKFAMLFYGGGSGGTSGEYYRVNSGIIWIQPIYTEYLVQHQPFDDYGMKLSFGLNDATLTASNTPTPNGSEFLNLIKGSAGNSNSQARIDVNVNVACAGDLVCAGTVSSGTGLTFRNRLINGDMRIDQRNGNGTTGAGGLAGSNLAYRVQPSYFYTVDRWAVASPNVGALVAKQVPLSAADRAATGGFANAVAVGLVPTDSLAVYLPVDGSIADASGNGLSFTTTGTMQYVSASVQGSNALYLANENQVLTTSVRASNLLYAPYTQNGNAVTVSCWMLFTKLPQAAFPQGSAPWSFVNSARTLQGFNVLVTTAGLGITYNSVGTTTNFAVSTNTWYHVVGVYIPSTSIASYVNGNLIGTVTSSVPSSFNTGPAGAANSFIQLGDSGAVFPFAGFIDDFRVYNRALSATEIAALATSVGIPAAPGTTVASGLTSLLTFDGTATDAQGTLPAPAVTGSAAYTPTCRVGTGSLDLTANTAGGTATNAITYNRASGSYDFPITLSGWINTSSDSPSISSVAICFGNNTAAATQSITVYVNTGSVTLNLFTNSTYYGGNFPVRVGVWYHVCIVASSAGYLNAYIDGVNRYSVALPSTSLGVSSLSGTPTQLRIGALTGTSLQGAFKGFVDDVRLYNRALSSAEVAGLYASSQHASYSIFQQTIEGNNLYDLNWGTPQAQPVTASMWLKNNASTPQQYSVAVDNATGLLAWIDFENSSFADKMGFLNGFSNIGPAPTSTSIFKVGTTSLNLTGNTAGGTATRALLYSLPYTISIPITISAWIYVSNITATGVFNIAVSIGNNTTVTSTISANLYTYQGSIYGDFRMGGTTYSHNSGVTHASNTWYHACFVIGNGNSSLYVDGVAVASRSFPPGPFEILNGSGQPNQLCIGANTGSPLNLAYNGYIDDVRLYNKALSPAQVAQLFANNATTTTTSTYLTPRSFVYNTPAIPANSWQRVSVTVPGDTSNDLMTNNDGGLTLSLALGASPLYNTNNVGAASGNSVSTWNSFIDYMGSNVQLYGGSSSNVLSSVANSVFVTGVQLEKGTLSTPFEVRPYGAELQLSHQKPILIATGGLSQILSDWAKLILSATVDTIGCFNNSRYTPNIAGYYHISVNCGNQAVNSFISVSIRVNNVQINQTTAVGSSGNYARTCVSTVVYMNGITDYIEIFVYSSVSSASEGSRLAIHQIT